MSTLRENGSRAPGAPDWKQPSSPHGYDQPEFGPAQAPRDYRRPKVHAADEERRRLRRAHEDLDDASNTGAKPSSEAWEREDPAPSTSAPPSRLYRD